MKNIKATTIVNRFYEEMNPGMWDGSGENPDSFDTHAWEYPLTDTVHLELAFGYDESDGGWKYFCDLVYSSDNSSFDMTNMIHTDDTIGVIHDYQTASPVLIIKDKSCFGSEEDGVGTIYIPIKFCPECGRKLGR